MLDILDTAGQEEFSAMRDQYTKTGQAFMLVFDMTSRSSFDSLQNYFRQVTLVKDTENAAIVIVANKCDLYQTRVVAMEEGQDVAKAWGCPYVETSAKNNINIGEAYSLIFRQATRYCGDITDPKIVMLGDGGVGKSAISIQYIQGNGGSTVPELSFDYYSGSSSSSGVKSGKRSSSIWDKVSGLFNKDSSKKKNPSIQSSSASNTTTSPPAAAPTPAPAVTSTSSAPAPVLAASSAPVAKQVPKKITPKSTEGLVLLQSASGYWNLNVELAAQIDVSLDELKKAIPANTNENVWSTVIAIAYFRNVFKNAEDEWILIVQKAETWLVKETGDRAIFDKLYKNAVKNFLRMRILCNINTL